MKDSYDDDLGLTGWGDDLKRFQKMYGPVGRAARAAGGPATLAMAATVLFKALYREDWMIISKYLLKNI